MAAKPARRVAIPRRRVTASGVAREVIRLGKRVKALERGLARVEGRKRRIGFQTVDARGDRETQDDDDPAVPDEC